MPAPVFIFTPPAPRHSGRALAFMSDTSDQARLQAKKKQLKLLMSMMLLFVVAGRCSARRSLLRSFLDGPAQDFTSSILPPQPSLPGYSFFICLCIVALKRR